MGYRIPSIARLPALLAAMLVSSSMLRGQAVTQPALKAAFIFNFAKFAEWPVDLAPAGPLALCVLDDSAVEDALSDLVAHGAVNGRGVTVVHDVRARPLRSCHLLYVGDPDSGRSMAILDDVKGAPVLTVGDGDQFARSGGMVGFFIEGGRMRFAINPDAAQRGGLRLSSRLLSLAKIVKDGRNGQS